MQIRKSILIFVIVAACLGCYFNTLFADFVFDDNIFITSNPYMKSFRFLLQFFTHEFWEIGIETITTGYYRPLLAASFMLDYTLWGDNPFGYHFTNIIFHILASILIFLFVELLLKNRFIAFTSALLFSVHPIHTEVASFISGRVDSIPLIFFLLSLILFLKYTSNKKIILYLFSLICFFISLLAKEMAVTLPLIVICMDYFFLSKRNANNVIKNFLRFHMGFLIVLGLYLFTRSYFIGWSFITVSVHKGINFDPGTHSFWRLFTVIKILTFYIRLLFLPCGLNVLHFFSASNSFLEPVVLIGFILLLLFIFIAIKNVKHYPILSFSILWFFITVLPVSNIFPQGNIFAERFMYTPSVGFCIGIAFLFSWLLKRNIKTHYLNWKKSLYVVFFLLIIALGRVTYERNKVWKNDFTLWHETVKASPNIQRSHVNLANAYYALNCLDEAIAEAKIALQLDPSYYRAFYTLGHVYLKKGLADEAIDEFKRVIAKSPNNAQAYNCLVAAYGIKGQYKEAIEAGLTALKKNPYLDWTRYNLALIYTKIGLIDEAIDAYEEYLKINPDYFGVHLDVGHLYYEKGDYQKARLHWLIALKINKDYQPAKDALELLGN